MTAALARLRGREPVRLYLYPVLVVVVGVLAALGYLDGSLANIALAGVALALGVPATELARAQVTPSTRVADAIAAGAHVAIEQARQPVREQLGDDGVAVLEQVGQQVEEYVGRHRASGSGR